MGNENKPQSGKKGEDVKRSVQRMDAGMQRKLMRGKVYNSELRPVCVPVETERRRLMRCSVQ